MIQWFKNRIDLKNRNGVLRVDYQIVDKYLAVHSEARKERYYADGWVGCIISFHPDSAEDGKKMVLGIDLKPTRKNPCIDTVLMPRSWAAENVRTFFNNEDYVVIERKPEYVLYKAWKYLPKTRP